MEPKSYYVPGKTIRRGVKCVLPTQSLEAGERATFTGLRASGHPSFRGGASFRASGQPTLLSGERQPMEMNARTH